MFINNMMDVVGINEQLPQLHGLVTGLRLTARNEPINKLRRYV